MERIGALDVLRGVAILGTLGTNIWIFTDPNGPLGVLNGLTGVTLPEHLLHFLTNGKFLGLLTIMFGIGLEIQYRSAARRGRPWPGWYLWRAALLFVEGLLHYLLIFEYDVLMGYAVTSMAVAYLVARSDRVINAWIVGAAAFHTLLVGLGTVALLAAPAGTAPSRGTTLYTDGTWTEQVVNRVVNAGVFRIEAVFIVPMGIALFLLGVRLMRAGVFEDSARGGRLRTRLMAVGLGVAAPLNLATTFAGSQWFLVDRYLLAPVVALGMLGLVTTLVLRARGATGPARRALTSVGRTALSCYVLQNLIASALCYGWGLGLAARLADHRLLWTPLAWAGIAALLAVLSTLWLRHFDRGPLEAAWHWAHTAPQRRTDLARVTDPAHAEDRSVCRSART